MNTQLLHSPVEMIGHVLWTMTRNQQCPLLLLMLQVFQSVGITKPLGQHHEVSGGVLVHQCDWPDFTHSSIYCMSLILLKWWFLLWSYHFCSVSFLYLPMARGSLHISLLLLPSASYSQACRSYHVLFLITTAKIVFWQNAVYNCAFLPFFCIFL